jgi:hypothetical protein
VINDFVTAVNEHIAMMQIPREFVFNIDETDLPFNLPAKRGRILVGGGERSLFLEMGLAGAPLRYSGCR